jgi:hypothetical protein
MWKEKKYKILEEAEERRPLGGRRRKCEDNIKMDANEM